ncbi:ras guanine nucleotide exchange factor domain-containing protein [Cladochytrium replicatum]|nr:ras guanine nucleotide exchange factor domain-containing protein [Cladochytrium replicatum]
MDVSAPLPPPPLSDYIDIVEALHDYAAPDSSMLSFRKRDILFVHAKDKSGWWDGSCGSKKGWFPSNYVRSIKDQYNEYLANQRSLDDSTPSIDRLRMTSAAANSSSPLSPPKSSSSNTSAAQKQLDHLTDQLSKLIADDPGLSGDESPALNAIGAADRSYTVSSISTNETAVNPANTDTGQELPPFWGRKKTQEGQLYYFNSQTDQTTYDINEVFAAKIVERRSTLVLDKERRASLKDAISKLSNGGAVPEAIKEERSRHPSAGGMSNSSGTGGAWIPGPQSLLTTSDSITRELLLSNILRSISDLNLAAKEDRKADFVNLTNQVVRSIRDMLAASGCISKDSPVLKSHRLRSQHHTIMSSLSKLVLAAKVASGLWPPPDGINKMRYQAGQVLLAVRQFDSVAHSPEIALQLKPISAADLATDEFDMKGAALSNIELVARLDSYTESIITSIARLASMIEESKTINETVIEAVRTTVVEIGQLMSLIEDLRYAEHAHSETLADFKQKKESLYGCVNDLVTRARVAMEQFAPPNAVQNLTDTTTAVLKVVEDMLMVTKLLIDENDAAEQRTLLNEAEMIDAAAGTEDGAELQLLQKRAMSLAYVKSASQEPPAPGSAAPVMQMQPMVSPGLGVTMDPAMAAMMMQRNVEMAGMMPQQYPGQGTPPIMGGPQSAGYAMMDSYNANQPYFGPPSAGVVGGQFVGGEVDNFGRRLSYTSSVGGNSQSGNNGHRRSLSQYTVHSTGSGSAPGLPNSPRGPGQQQQPMYIPQQQPGYGMGSAPPPPLSMGSYGMGGGYGGYPVQGQQSPGRSAGEGRSSNGSGGEQSAKLLKFFGEELKGGPVVRPSNDSERPWFLRQDYAPNDISLNMEKQVTGGTFRALVEYLTVHDQPTVDPYFFNAFLMTFHNFATPQDLFGALQARFFLQPPPNLAQDELRLWDERKLKPIRVRVVNAYKAWLELFWVDPLDDAILDQLHQFANGILRELMPPSGLLISEIISKKLNQMVQMQNRSIATGSMVISLPPNYPPQPPPGSSKPAPIVPKNLRRFALMELDPVEVARQLTLLESQIFYRIQPFELMNQEWAKTVGTSMAVNVKEMASLSTKMTGWVAETIVLEKDLKKRAAILKNFIRIGEVCLELKNFNTLMAIQSALNSSTIARLKRTWDAVGSKSKTVFERLRKATDHNQNYADYRSFLRNSAPPCLPFLGLYLTDLTFTEDGNPNTRDRGRLINFDKYLKKSKIVQDLQRFQSLSYPLVEVVELQRWLQDSIAASCRNGVQDLYRMSLHLEPKDDPMGGGGSEGGGSDAADAAKEYDQKLKMLEKAGLL